MDDSWKQPTPTDGLYNSNLNEVDWMVFCYAWNMVRREDGVYEFFHGNRFFSVNLKRGQCVFRVSRIAELLEIDRKKIRRSIKKLQKWYTEMDTEAKPYGLVLTFKRADEMFKMDTEMDSERTVREQTKNNERTPSKKTVKTVKTVKNVESIKKKTPAKKKTKEKPYSKPGVLLEEKFQRELYEHFEHKLSLEVVREECENAHDWLGSKGVTRDNYLMFMRIWLRKTLKSMPVSETNLTNSIDKIPLI